MNYTIEQHKHNFSVWAAARAAQRGFTNLENLRDALEASGIREFLNNPNETNMEEFQNLHKKWCKKIMWKAGRP